jgi:SAM-dependent methyltransferase
MADPDPLPASAPATPRMYSELARWWPLLSPPAEYAEEAAFYESALRRASDRPPRTLLELGSGGGNNASFMKRSFRATLADVSAEMLAVSRRLNPECEHVQGDMRELRLGREFDCVFVHDAVCHMTTEADLRRAIETAYVHCRPGGVALFAPDHLRETFRAATEHGGSGDEGGGEAMRYLLWSWDPDPADTTCVTDYAFLLRDASGDVRVVHERHVEGLFGRDAWLRLLGAVGFEPRVLTFDHSTLEPGSYEVFLARRPAADDAIGPGDDTTRT